MLSDDGPKVLEFNCRFGDPETQAILPLLAGDLADALRSCADGQLEPDALAIKPGAAVCVVLAAPGYPEQPRRGDAITGIAAAEAMGALVFHAGTARRGNELVTNGGRVLSVVGVAADLGEAADRAYAAADTIAFAGNQLRRDVAAAARLVPA
jgi:phosphoribosylamine--glycine ligase